MQGLSPNWRKREKCCGASPERSDRAHSGSVEGYNYSLANKNSSLTWDEATFRNYIKDPRAKVPGTKMIYAGLKDEQKVNDLVAYLKQFDANGKKVAQ